MRYQRWSACADYHGDKHDPKSAALFRAFVEDYRPQRRWMLGDVWDFRAWRVGADEEERREKVREDFAAGMEFLAWYKPHVITLGNHDIRLWDTRDRGGPMSDFCDTLIKEFRRLADCLGVKILPYDKRKGVHQEGRLKMAHGFFDGTNAAKRMAESYGSILFGHGHAIDVATTPGPEPRAGRMIGCLCALDFRYNRSHVTALRQRHGWAYGTLFKNGTYQAFQAEVIGQHVVIADRIKVLSA